MDYEKKYNEAVCNIQKLLENGRKEGEVICAYEADFMSIFPELKESEDEKIRNWLIGYFHQYKEDGVEKYANGLKVESIITWLEKQGEHSVSPLFTFDDVLAIQCAMAYAKFQDRELDVALKKLHDKVYDAYHDSKNHHIESQDDLKGEQKPWSEEDNFMYNKIKNLLTDISLAPESIKSLFDWLKDLRDRVQPQNRWKPTKKQIVALRYVLNHLPYCTHKEEISGLLDQIKDL